MSACNCIGPPGRCPCVMGSGDGNYSPKGEFTMRFVDYLTLRPVESYRLEKIINDMMKNKPDPDEWNGPKC